MAFTHSSKKILGVFSLIAILAVAIIGVYLLITGNSSQASEGQYKMDAWCNIQEFSTTLMHDWNRTSVHVTDEDLRPYPEFGKYLHDVNDDPRVWHFGMRPVKVFDCNGSRAMQFLTLYEKYEETPSMPTLEYNGHYYLMGFDYLDAHSTATPTPAPPPAQPDSPAVPVPGSTQDPVSLCNNQVADSRIPVPVNISNAIRDPIPGIRYSLNESESGRTIVLGTGEIVEINLRWVPGVAWNWIIPVSGCGLELVQSGVYSDGGDFWNVTGHYRVRYRAVSPGTSLIDGTFGGTPGGMAKGMPKFNLTVIVK